MALTELKGQKGGTQKVVIERGPVRVFANVILDPDPVYNGDGAPVPPTFPFVMSYWGSLGEGGAAGLPIEKLRGPGRAILHGEQEFEYYRWPKVGDVLEGTMTITDVYEKERSNGGNARVLRHRDRLERRRDRRPGPEGGLHPRHQLSTAHAGLTLGDMLREHRAATRSARLRRRRRAPHLARARRPGQPAGERARRRGRRTRRPMLCGSARTRSASLEVLLAAAKLGAVFCPANWRQSRRRVRLRDRRPRPGGRGLAGRTRSATRVRAARAARDVRGRGGSATTPTPATRRLRGVPGLAGAPSRRRPDRVVDPAAPVLLLYTAAFDRPPQRGAAVATPRCIAQGLVIGRLAGRRRRRTCT